MLQAQNALTLAKWQLKALPGKHYWVWTWIQVLNAAVH